MIKTFAVFSGNSLVSRHMSQHAAEAAAGPDENVRQWKFGYQKRGGWYGC